MTRGYLYGEDDDDGPTPPTALLALALVTATVGGFGAGAAVGAAVARVVIAAIRVGREPEAGDRGAGAVDRSRRLRGAGRPVAARAMTEGHR